LKPLSGLDSLFLHLETPATPMHVGAVHLLQRPRRGGDFLLRVRRHVARRLHLSPVFTRQLASMPLDFANPVWVRAPCGPHRTSCGSRRRPGHCATRGGDSACTRSLLIDPAAVGFHVIED
jgi:hypothetical protein